MRKMQAQLLYIATSNIITVTFRLSIANGGNNLTLINSVVYSRAIKKLGER